MSAFSLKKGLVPALKKSAFFLKKGSFLVKSQRKGGGIFTPREHRGVRGLEPTPVYCITAIKVSNFCLINITIAGYLQNRTFGQFTDRNIQ